jgi:hypothetical protein
MWFLVFIFLCTTTSLSSLSFNPFTHTIYGDSMIGAFLGNGSKNAIFDADKNHLVRASFYINSTDSQGKCKQIESTYTYFETSVLFM